MNWSKKLHKIFTKEEPLKLIGKLKAEFHLYEIEGESVISSINHNNRENAYVVSPYSLIVNYSKDELFKIDSKVQRTFFSLLIKLFGYFLKISQIDRVQTLNNLMLSTNFFSKAWESFELKELEKKALFAYPKHLLLLRSVNQTQNPKLFKKLREDGWIGVVVRQVYLFKSRERWERKRDSKKDKKLQDDKRFSFEKVERRREYDFERMRELYNMVYLKKHSEHNLHYQVRFFEKMVEEELFELYILRESASNSMVGVIAFTLNEELQTIPLLGYDTSYPQKDALYRRLMYFGIDHAFEKNLLLNISSGASSFKMSRGAEPELEYMFVKADHLPLYRRVVWRLLSYLSEKFYAPMLIQSKL